MTVERIWCLLVPTADVFFVDIDNKKNVHELKIAIKEITENIITCYASRLNLYFAKKTNEEWLTSKDEIVKALEEGEISDEFNKIMTRSQRLDPEDIIEALNLPTNESVIHVVVQMPAANNALSESTEPPTKRIRIETDASHEDLFNKYKKELPFKASAMQDSQVTPGNWFDVVGLDVAGLANKSDAAKRVYCRNDTIALLGALDNMRSGLRIQGPPGVGKSVTSWFWACNQVKKGKSVLWTHVGLGVEKTTIVMTQENTYHINAPDIAEFLFDAPYDIVVVDGVRNNLQHQVLENLFNFSTNPLRNAISVASMAVDTSDEDDAAKHIDGFQANPWSLDEYMAAAKDKIFFMKVLPCLVDEGIEKYSDINTLTERLNESDTMFDELSTELILNKFYVAGSSCRWMYGTFVQDVIAKIEKFIKKVRNMTALLNLVTGETHNDSVNHLLCSYNGKLFFTSKYVLEQVIMKAGYNAIQTAYSLAKAFGNPSFTGWVVEMDFIYQIKVAKGKKLQLTLSDKRPTDNKRVFDPLTKGNPIDFEVADYVECDTENSKAIEQILAHHADLNNLWLLPKRCNQAGYDLVWVRDCAERVVLRFIQVTRSEKHEFHLKSMHELAKKFDDLGKKIYGIEVFMVIPNTNVKVNLSLPKAKATKKNACEESEENKNNKAKVAQEFEKKYIGDSDKLWGDDGREDVHIVYFQQTWSVEPGPIIAAKHSQQPTAYST